MDNVKLNLKITLPGRVLMSEKECSKNPKNNYELHSLKIDTMNKKKRVTETINYRTRKCYTASKSINICKDAYNYMTGKAKNKKEDSSNCPSWAIPNKWFYLSKSERLEAHLKRIMEHFGGISYSYQIFED